MAVVGMQGSSVVLPTLQGPFEKSSTIPITLFFMHCPADEGLVEDIYDHVGIVEEAVGCSGQPGDVTWSDPVDNCYGGFPHPFIGLVLLR